CHLAAYQLRQRRAASGHHSPSSIFSIPHQHPRHRPIATGIRSKRRRRSPSSLAAMIASLKLTPVKMTANLKLPPTKPPGNVPYGVGGGSFAPLPAGMAFVGGGQGGSGLQAPLPGDLAAMLENSGLAAIAAAAAAAAAAAIASSGNGQPGGQATNGRPLTSTGSRTAPLKPQPYEQGPATAPLPGNIDPSAAAAAAAVVAGAQVPLPGGQPKPSSSSSLPGGQPKPSPSASQPSGQPKPTPAVPPTRGQAKPMPSASLPSGQPSSSSGAANSQAGLQQGGCG
ncbi:hypothetical protein DUNSADRAFT_15231, partial [Dunaliella salina]